MGGHCVELIEGAALVMREGYRRVMRTATLPCKGAWPFSMTPAGLEPAAYCLGGSRSIHLSYEVVETK